MKRSASSNCSTSLVPTKEPRQTRRRVTRSVQRETIAQAQEAEARLKKHENDAAKALVLKSTPLLQALPFLIFSGYLYKHECRNAAVTCQNWKAIVSECQEFIPEESLVEIVVEKETDEWPDFVIVRGLQEVIPSQTFCRVIFQKLCDLKVAVETTERKKKKALEALPKWGVDFLGIHILCWGPNTRNGGGIHLTFLKKDLNGCLCSGDRWKIRLDHRLRLWSFGRFQKWKNIYDYEPLWRSSSIESSLHLHSYLEFEDDSVSLSMWDDDHFWLQFEVDEDDMIDE